MKERFGERARGSHIAFLRFLSVRLECNSYEIGFGFPRNCLWFRANCLTPRGELTYLFTLLTPFFYLLGKTPARAAFRSTVRIEKSYFILFSFGLWRMRRERVFFFYRSISAWEAFGYLNLKKSIALINYKSYYQSAGIYYAKIKLKKRSSLWISVLTSVIYPNISLFYAWFNNLFSDDGRNMKLNII